MEVVCFFFALIIIIVLLVNNNRLVSRLDNLEKLMVDLRYLVEKVKRGQQDSAAQAKEPEPPKVEPQPLPPLPKAEHVPEVKRPYVVEPPMPDEVERVTEVIEDPLAKLRKQQATVPPPQRKIPEPQPSFFERHPDLEKFIGENLVNKIGIAILVLAIGFFVKYAIDQNWVGPAGRVAIGIACGGILIVIAHRLRKSYKAFSSVLVGGGLAVFYFTITLAFHEFHLFSQTVSFIILIVVTCFAVALSLLYDRQELAIIALVGGMSSPFMVSTGQANYNALFIYYIVLNSGLVIVAYFKSWRILNILAFALTVLVLGGVLYTVAAKDAGTVFVYTSILYVIFFLTNIGNNIKENKAFIASDFTILLANTALYFAAGLYLLHLMKDDQFRGLFCAAIGGLNLFFSFLLFRSKKAEINILYLLIGITLTFLSLTAPIQLHGHFITLFWAAESVLIYWLYTKSNIRIMQWASLIIWVAMFCSLLMDWFELYGDSFRVLTIIGNKGFVTTVFASLCSFLLYALVNKSAADKRLAPPAIFKYLAFILLFCAGALEINHQFASRYPDSGLNYLYLMLYLPAFVYLFTWGARKIPALTMGWQAETVLFGTAIVVYLLFTQQYFDVQAGILLAHKIDPSHFISHWIAVVFVILIFLRLIAIARDNFGSMAKPAGWLLSGSAVLFLSLEICLLTNSLFYRQGMDLEHIQTIYIKTGLPVLWGISSFVLMWLGMRYKARALRIISLTLFTITLVKLFVYDIENIPAGGKIAAFFCLGVLLLIISFMYQKVKYIITDDESKPKD
jgi:uncharacterized membrane protein